MKRTKYTEEFETFWVKYPPRWNSNLGTYVKRKKWPAFQSWQKLSKKIRAECLAKAHLIRKTEGTPRDCVTWLNQCGWDDIDFEPPKKTVLPPEILSKAIQATSIPKEKPVDVNARRNKEKDKLGVH
jgi:hypothetical protein